MLFKKRRLKNVKNNDHTKLEKKAKTNKKYSALPI